MINSSSDNSKSNLKLLAQWSEKTKAKEEIVSFVFHYYNQDHLCNNNNAHSRATPQNDIKYYELMPTVTVFNVVGRNKMDNMAK